MSAAALPDGEVAAIVVSFHPDPGLLGQVLERLEGEVAQILVVDNGSPAATVQWLRGWAAGASTRQLLANTDNRGIAAAFNQGIAAARGSGAGYVLLLDQDSRVQPGMLALLRRALEEATASDRPVAAVGPAFVDRRSGETAPFVRIGWVLNHKLAPPASGSLEVDFLISSGSLIPVPVLDRIGAMHEPLFIDNVDMEWAFRARAAGYRLLGVGHAWMEHAIGDRVVSVGLGRRRLSFAQHGPQRLYYMTRNRLWLYRQPVTPGAWVSQDIPRLLLKTVGVALAGPQRWRSLRAIALGALDAVRGRLGPCQHRT